MKISQTALQKFQSLLSLHSPQSVNVNVKIDAGHLPTDCGIQCEIPFLVRVLLGDFPQSSSTSSSASSPVNVCIVLDVSGSMQEGLKGEENRHHTKLSACKVAIKELLTNFLTDQDTVHLIKYSNNSSIVFQDKNKNSVELADIDNINTSGSTNISDAIFDAVDLLRKSKGEGTKLIAFFSDGCANMGITDVNVFGSSLVKKLSEDIEDQIHISSFGVGSDYDEKWLQAIARTGKGEYYYLDNESKAKEAFEKSLKKYQFQIGKNFKIKASGLNGISVKSFNQKSDMTSLLQGMTINGVFCRDLRLIEGILCYNPIQNLTQQALQDESNNGGLPMLKIDYSYTDNATEQVVSSSITYVHTRFVLSSENPYEIQPLLELYNKSDERNDFIAQKVCQETAQLQAKFNELVMEASHNSNAKQSALEIARQIESSYAQALPHDEYGIVEQLLSQATNQREELEKHGISASFQKFVSKSASVALKVAKKEKKQKYEEEYEDDCDCDEAYGGLF